MPQAELFLTDMNKFLEIIQEANLKRNSDQILECVIGALDYDVLIIFLSLIDHPMIFNNAICPIATNWISEEFFLKI